MTLRKIGFPIGTTNIQDVCFIFQKRNGKCENISASINSKLHIQKYEHYSKSPILQHLLGWEVPNDWNMQF